MDLKGIRKLIRVAQVNLDKNSPAILTGLGIAGIVTAVVMGVRATPKAMQLLAEEEKARFEEGTTVPMTNLEVVEVAWKCYVPTVLMTGATIGCIIAAQTINTRRLAALASVYSLTEATLKEYQVKVIDTVGDKKAKKIKDDIAADHISKNPVDEDNVIQTGRGTTLCYDWVSGRYFRSDIEYIRQAENRLNRDLLADNYVSLNEVYDEIGLPRIGLGEELGWSLWVDDQDQLVTFKFSSQLTDKGEPCLVVEYAVMPRFDYTH